MHTVSTLADDLTGVPIVIDFGVISEDDKPNNALE
jgi:hypothetical protein